MSGEGGQEQRLLGAEVGGLALEEVEKCPAGVGGRLRARPFELERHVQALVVLVRERRQGLAASHRMKATLRQAR